MPNKGKRQQQQKIAGKAKKADERRRQVSAKSFIKAALKAARQSAKTMTSTAVCCLGTGTSICWLSDDKMSPDDGLMFAGGYSLQKNT